MHIIESILFWATISLYVSTIILQVYIFIFKKEKLLDLSVKLSWGGFAFHTLTFISRWIIAGHAPVMGNYENALVGAWFIVGGFIFLQLKFEAIEKLSMILLIIVLVTMGYGLMSPTEPSGLTPPYQSPWLIVHIAFAWLAYMSFTIAAVLGIGYLLKDSGFKHEYITKLPKLGILDDLGYRLIAFGLVMDTVMLVAGAIWANRLWGTYWSWDPVETWSLICWLVYGIYLHLRLTLNWDGRRGAWLAVGALATVIFSAWGVNFFDLGKHIFENL